MSLAADRNTPILFLMETWLTEGNNATTAAIKSYGYRIIHEIRDCTKTKKKRGGGVAIICKNSLNFTKEFIDCNMETAEFVAAKIKTSCGKILLCCSIYRTDHVTDAFFCELDELLSNILIKFSYVLICGDINIHLDNPYCSYAKKFENLIASFGLKQFVSVPTHKSGHTIDVVIASPKIVDELSIKVEPKISEAFPGCDHYPISFQFDKKLNVNSSVMKDIVFRNLKNIDGELFHDHLLNIIKLSDKDMISSSFSEAISSFNFCCNLLIDSHAPLLSKTIRNCPSSPWFDGEYKRLRTLRRHAEKKWLKSKDKGDILENKDIYISLRDQCNILALEKKKKYYQEQFENHKHSSKSLFSFVEKFTDKEKDLILPSSESIQEIADDFNNYFQEKIDLIRCNFKESDFSEFSNIKFSGEYLSDFRPATVEEISEILKDCDLKTSSVDPLPASLISENLDTLLPYFCYIVNLSLSSGSIDGAKLAHVIPLIKDKTIDSSNLKNYRPISNLSFIGKLVERIILRRLNEHLENNNLNMAQQSGYKKYFSTETLLVNIMDDILVATDENKATVVMLLDLSAAFDTVDHGKLLKILHHEIGITGNALKWFRSFITGRSQLIRIGNAQSETLVMKFGVPQGSVLGPILFNLYIRSLYRTVQNLSFSIHGYADDHQVYKSFNSKNQYPVLVQEIPACFAQINKWMAAHFLQLNPGKTEMIIFGTPKVLSAISIHGSFLSNSTTCIRYSPIVKNLGIKLDSNLFLTKQVNHVKSSCYYKLRSIAKMKPFLDTKQLTMLVQATVIPSLDYCNSIYSGCNSSVLKELQNIQNRACRLIFGLRKRDSVHSYLISLHWLKIEQRIQFKILLLVHKCILGIAPSYLSEKITQTNISYSRAVSLHIPPKINLKAFSSSGPLLWNSLPIEIKTIDDTETFKKQLKTYLFKKCYGDDIS